MATKRPQTLNRGASDERAAILRKVRRMRRESLDYGCEACTGSLDRLLKWLLSRVNRVIKRPGGLRAKG